MDINWHEAYHRQLGAFDALRSIIFAIDGGNGLSKRCLRNILTWVVDDVALERWLILNTKATDSTKGIRHPTGDAYHFIRPSITMVNPPPGTHAFPVGARGHVGGNVEGCVTMPNTFVLDGHDDHVFRAYVLGVVRISDRESTSGKIGMTRSVQVWSTPR